MVAKGDPIVLNFVGLNDEQAVDNYYNGGLSGDGVGPGPADGIVFTSNGLSIISSDSGGSGNFNDAPSDTILFFLSGGAATMDVAGGFTTGFSFYYSAVNNPGTINVWSGLDDTGTLLATLALPVTPSGGGTCDTTFCPWFPIGVSFAGTAMSVDFGGTENQIGFDNITLGASSPGGSAPEPSSFAMLGLGMAGLGWLARRRKA
jgi:hypothetical protein